MLLTRRACSWPIWCMQLGYRRLQAKASVIAVHSFHRGKSALCESWEAVCAALLLSGNSIWLLLCLCIPAWQLQKILVLRPSAGNLRDLILRVCWCLAAGDMPNHAAQREPAASVEVRPVQFAGLAGRCPCWVLQCCTAGLVDFVCTARADPAAEAGVGRSLQQRQACLAALLEVLTQPSVERHHLLKGRQQHSAAAAVGAAGLVCHNRAGAVTKLSAFPHRTLAERSRGSCACSGRHPPCCSRWTWRRPSQHPPGCGVRRPHPLRGPGALCWPGGSMTWISFRCLPSRG